MDYDKAIDIAKSEASPRELAQTRVWLAGHYAYLNGLITEILIKKPFVWEKLREEVKSDTRAERKWQMTEDGQEEIKLSRNLKSIEKLLSAMNTRLKVAEGEAINNY